jgi:alkylation response protein AidB-like acyl-CoA dehydrogenase
VHLAYRPLSSGEQALRDQVREFLAEHLPPERRVALGQAGAGARDLVFSRLLAEQGWVGMSIPTRYGGRGASAVERFVVTEELLAAQAPVAAHWVADRQTAPSILSHGSEEQKKAFLPAIAAGECFFAIGMSEPDAGSDLAAVRTRAVPADGGWRVTGTKVWTTGAHESHFFAALCRTDNSSDDHHQGLSQLIVDLASPGVDIRPITTLDGDHEFCEVILDDVFVPDGMLLGRPGEGWQQVTSELSFERYGPERWLSTWAAFTGCVAAVGDDVPASVARALGRLAARFRIIRHLSLGVADMLDGGGRPMVEAAAVKDIGTQLERDVLEVVRDLLDLELDPGTSSMFEGLLCRATLTAPFFTLRGGTTEVLRSIISRGLAA